MKDLITEARELCEKATPGPWEWTVSDILGTELDAENLKGVIRLADDYPGYPECGEHLIMQLSESDAAFIARSRTLIPELVDALGKAQAEIERLREAQKKIESCKSCARYVEECYRFYTYPCSECKHRSRDSYVPLPAPPKGE